MARKVPDGEGKSPPYDHCAVGRSLGAAAAEARFEKQYSTLECTFGPCQYSGPFDKFFPLR